MFLIDYIKAALSRGESQPILIDHRTTEAGSAQGGSDGQGCHERDYSLIGRDAQAAVESGLAAAEWYHTDIPRKQMKELMKREDGPAIRDTILWLGSMSSSSAASASAFWGSWWCVPFFLVYGVLYGSASDSRWHECGHGTAFKTRWMNDAVYEIACFMIMRNPVDLALEPYAAPYRHGHRRPRPGNRRHAAAGSAAPASSISSASSTSAHAMIDMVRNAFGVISAAEKTFVPEQEQPQGHPHRPHLAGDLCRDDRALRSTWARSCR